MIRRGPHPILTKCLTDKDKPPGLARAVWRDRLTNPAHLAAVAACLGGLVLIGVTTVRIPASVTYLTARIDTASFAQTDYGARPVYTATAQGGQTFHQVASAPRSQIVLSPGDTVCLRVQTDRFTGRVTARHAPENPDCTQANTTK